MSVTERNGDIIIENRRDLELAQIFECGQCFRFNQNADGSYTGTAFGKTVRISQEGGTVVLHGVTAEDFRNIWYGYLDLGRDYGAIKARLAAGDAVMAAATERGSGIRILRQEPWETIISFIISASNNIPRIKGIIERLCRSFGEPHEYEGEIHYAFPTPERLAGLDLAELSVIRAGFRDKYILGCARRVASGELDLERLETMPTPAAKRELMRVYGVGNKVADCVLLFGLGRVEAFPIDVWIKRTTERSYFGGEPRSIKEIADFAAAHFGEYGGIAQQYLFYAARGDRGNNR